MTERKQIMTDGEKEMLRKEWINTLNSFNELLGQYHRAIKRISPEEKTTFTWLQALPIEIEQFFKYMNGGIFILQTKKTVELLESAQKQRYPAKEFKFWTQYSELQSAYGEGKIPGIVDIDIKELKEEDLEQNRDSWL